MTPKKLEPLISDSDFVIDVRSDAVIDISMQSGNWPDIQDELIKGLRLTLKEADFKTATVISLVLADDAFVQDLNKTYRHKDKPTNVLSFPQDEDSMLGDIVLAYETIAREAKEQDKSFLDHSIHLVIHGLLHLLGHDHENDAEAEDMEAIEIRVLNILGIKNPYESGNFVP